MGRLEIIYRKQKMHGIKNLKIVRSECLVELAGGWGWSRTSKLKSEQYHEGGEASYKSFSAVAAFHFLQFSRGYCIHIIPY